MTQLHPGAKWLFRIRAWGVAIFLGAFLIVLDFIALVNKIDAQMNGYSGSASTAILTVFSIVTLLYIVIALLLSEVYVRLAYKNWSYEFTASNLKVERGIIWKKYSNIPYARVQNVDIRRGILARMLGYSEVNVQTAGYSATPQGVQVSEGYLPALAQEDAEKVRDFLMQKIQGKKSGGL